MVAKETKPTFLSLVRRYAFPLRKQIALLVLLTLLANLFTVIQPLILSGVMEVVLDAQDGGIGTIKNIDTKSEVNANFFDLNYIGKKVKKSILDFAHIDAKNLWANLGILFTLFIASVFFASVLNYLSLLVTRWIRGKATAMIRLDILRHLLSLNLGFFHKQKSGELISRITQDAENTGQGLGPLIQCWINYTLLIIIYGTYLFSTSHWMAIAAIGMVSVHFGFSHFIKKPVQRNTRGLFDRTAGLTTTLQETFTSIRVIKSFGAESYELNKLGRDIEAVRIASFREGVVRHVEPHAREFLDSFAFTGIFLIAVFQLMRHSLSVQGFLLFIYVGRLLIVPINNFAVNFIWAKAMLASYERLAELFSEKPFVLDGNIIKTDFRENIVLNNVSFSYGAANVIEDVSLTINKGEVVALVGPSGAGKSTLTDLILRVYDPQKGKILIDGANLRTLKVSDYSKIFGVVPQESLLFNDTIENNIRYGRGRITDDQIREAAKISNAHDFIMELPDGYQTYVGDRGVRLSGGQRQRIAIARAIVSDPEIIIFDEATSSLDSESERQVQIAIDRVLENSTAIIIAHRLSTVLHAHKTIVLQKGKIEAIGRHDKLLSESPTYKLLYESQFRNIKIGAKNS